MIVIYSAALIIIAYPISGLTVIDIALIAVLVIFKCVYNKVSGAGVVDNYASKSWINLRGT